MNQAEIVTVIVQHLKQTNNHARKHPALPVDRSLFELGILDSFGVVELVSFIEQRWSIEILDTELTDEMFGGIEKMAKLVSQKLEVRA